MPNLVGMMHRT